MVDADEHVAVKDDLSSGTIESIEKLLFSPVQVQAQTCTRVAQTAHAEVPARKIKKETSMVIWGIRSRGQRLLWIRVSNRLD